eukprot:3077247-Ditylum_brightwellii.AAC.1
MAEGLDTTDVQLKFQELINAKYLKISHITPLANHLKTEVLCQTALLKRRDMVNCKDWRYHQRNGEGKKNAKEKKQDDGKLPKANIYKLRAYEAMFLD